PHLQPRTPRCPPWNASPRPAFLPGYDESPEAVRFLFRVIAAPAHQPALHPQPKPPPAGAARSAQSILPDSPRPPAQRRQTFPAMPPPRKGTASQSIPSSPKWIAVSQSGSFSFLSDGSSLTYDLGE